MLHDRQRDDGVGYFAVNRQRLVQIGHDVSLERMQRAAPIHAGVVAGVVEQPIFVRHLATAEVVEAAVDVGLAPFQPLVADVVD